MNYQINPAIPSNIFRAYDIRGTVEDLLTDNNVYSIGRAIGSAAQAEQESSVIVARDGRLSGPALSAALIQGILDSGCNVIDVGMVPTPLLYFATHVLPTRSGVMLTGSHNPVNYNGLKIVLNGKSVADQGILDLRRRIVDNDLLMGRGQLSQSAILEAYIEKIISTVHLDRPLKIVVDCGSGVAGVVAPLLFQRLGCEVIELYCTVDGHFPHHHPDPSRPENLKDLIAAVQTHQADLGLAFDGDGDRLGVVSNLGEMIFPDRQLMLFAQDVLQRNPGATIIYDVKSTRHLAPMILKSQGDPLLWKTGHSFIKNKMQETGALLAGEMSGHVFFKERWYGFDDGLYAGARLLEILSKQALPSAAVFDTLPKDISTPEINIAMSDETKFAFIERLIANTSLPEAKKITIDGLRLELAEGWGLIRCSNTTPCLVLRFEADNEASLEKIKQIFRQAILAVEPNLVLAF